MNFSALRLLTTREGLLLSALYLFSIFYETYCKIDAFLRLDLWDGWEDVKGVWVGRIEKVSSFLVLMDLSMTGIDLRLQSRLLRVALELRLSTVVLCDTLWPPFGYISRYLLVLFLIIRVTNVCITLNSDQSGVKFVEIINIFVVP